MCERLASKRSAHLLSLEHILPMPPLNPNDHRSTFERALGSLPKLPKTPAEINAARGLTPEKEEYGLRSKRRTPRVEYRHS